MNGATSDMVLDGEGCSGEVELPAIAGESIIAHIGENSRYRITLVGSRVLAEDALENILPLLSDASRD